MNRIVTNFYRGKIIESSHSIKALISKINGEVIYSTDNDNDLIYPRSSIKIFQAIPFILSKAPGKFNLNEKKIALSCSSHRGEAYHIKELNDWVNKININKNLLRCGIHNPLNKIESDRFLRSNKKANQLYNNCAGKHLAMLSSCIANRYNTKKYLNFNHKHQSSIRKIFEKFTKTKINKNNYGIDGCSAPQYCFMIKDISTLLNNLIKSYKDEFYYSNETNILINSVLKYPKFIGGSDSLDSRIMQITKNKLFCKGGAEGVFLFVHLKKNISGIIKVSDGNERAMPSVIYNLFKKFSILNKDELIFLKKASSFNIINHANLKIGLIDTRIKS